MLTPILAVTVSPPDPIFEQLKAALARQDEAVWLTEAHSCMEAANALHSLPIDIVFTGVRLSDGDWQDVLKLAQPASGQLPVVVVARFPDMALYVEAMDGGASDLIAPPFEEAQMRRLLGCIRTLSSGIPRSSDLAAFANLPPSRPDSHLVARGARVVRLPRAPSKFCSGAGGA